MEAFLLAVLCIAVIGLAIKLSRLTGSRSTIAELNDLIQRLEQRIANLERQVAHQSVRPLESKQPATPAVQLKPFIPLSPAEHNDVQASAADHVLPIIAATANSEGTAPIPSAPPPPLPIRPVMPLQSASVPVARSISIEERLGQNWLSKIGIVLVVLGVATFLGYKLVTLGPLGKSLTGLATALALLFGGLLLERKPTYRIFARAGIGGGWALLFFIAFAVYHVDAMRVLTSQAADLFLMAAVAAAIVWYSLRYKSQIVTALAFLLAFATVGISDITLFSLVAGALLAAALVSIAAREYWFELGLAGLCGVYINHFIWLHHVLPEGGQIGHTFPDFFPSACLLLLYWLLFRLFYVLRVPRNPQERLVASLTAILNSVGLLGLLKYQSSHPEWAFYALLALGTVEFIFAFIARPRNRSAFLVLATLASALLLAAIPFRFAGSNWTLLWLFEAEALLVAGILIREKALRRIGLAAGLLTSLQLLFVGTLPVLGVRLFTVDTSSHSATAISLIAAALLFWFNSEYCGRRWSDLFEEALDSAALTATSYIAATAMAGALWLWVPEHWLSIFWGILGIILFELGTLLHRRSLRQQAYAVFAAIFLRVFIYDLNFSFFSNSGLVNHHIAIVLPVIAAYIWIYHRTHSALAESAFDRAAGTIAAWLGTTTSVTIIYLELRPEFILIGWSVLAIGLLSAAWLLSRQIFTEQAFALLAAVAVQCFSYNLIELLPKAATSFWSTRAATVSVACAILLAALPAAFAIRRNNRAHASNADTTSQWQLLLDHPEQPFFFVPYALIAILIAFELRTGMITLGWIALGLTAFLAALPIGERSYRLAGLGMLLIGIGKIVLVDIWSLSTTDRILTLIVSGVALLLVSFLYSRYRETILKFL